MQRRFLLFQTFCVLAARPQDYSVLTDIDSDLAPGCDYRGREALLYNGVVCQWEQFCTFVWKFQKFVKYKMNECTVINLNCTCHQPE